MGNEYTVTVSETAFSLYDVKRGDTIVVTGMQDRRCWLCKLRDWTKAAWHRAFKK